MPKKELSQERLWAPWRYPYVKSQKPKTKKCIFCHARQSKNDEENYVVHRAKRCFVILNRYPYNNGHVMVAPNRHVANLTKLTRDEWIDLFSVAIEVKKHLTKQLKAQGFNIGLNIGEAAGAGIKDHLHLHLVPRWNGDTNFMPVVGETKVISQSMEVLYVQLVKAFAKKKKAVRK